MKIITDIGNWLISSGALTALFIFAWKYIKPWLEAKKAGAKTVQEKELLELVDKLADNAVNSLAGNNDITGREKFKIATQTVTNTLDAKGLKTTDEAINHAVQAAYEKSDLTPTINPDDAPQTGVIVNG